MERKFFFYKQPVAFTELNAAFDGAENAVDNLVIDYGLNGLVSGLVVQQHNAGDLTVNVTSGVAYDSNGKRIDVSTTQNVNCAVDYLAVSTTVSGGGNSKILSLFAQFEQALSDARTDGNGSTVYFEHAESFVLEIHQGTEASSPSPLALIPGKVLLADITISHGTTQILTGQISFARTQYYGNPAPVSVPAASGTRFSLAAGVLPTQLAAIQAQIDSTLSSGADTIKQFASISALRAAGAPSYTTAAVATVPTFGLFVWTPGSSATDDGLFVIQPTGVSGSGRWLSMTAQIGVANGLAKLDGSGKAANVKNGLVSIQVLQGVANFSGNGSITGYSMTFSSTVAGDSILLIGSASMNCTIGSSNYGEIQLTANENGGGASNIGGAKGSFGQSGSPAPVSAGASTETVPIIGQHTIGTGGSCVIAAVSSGNNQEFTAPNNLLGVQFRP